MSCEYYILIEDFWQNNYVYFVGPFNSRKEANAEVYRVCLSTDYSVVLAGASCQDVKNSLAIRGVLTKSQAIKAGLVEFFHDDGWDNVVCMMPHDTQELLTLQKYI